MSTLKKDELPMVEIKDKAGKIMKDVAGLVSIKVLNVGLELDILETMNELDRKVTAKELAETLDYDEVYLRHWLDSAYAFEYVKMDRNGDLPSYSLADHIDKLLLNSDFQGYIGGFPGLFDMEEMFGWFTKNIQSGERIWWEDASHEWIKQVGETTLPTYTRMVTKDFSAIPKLEEKLEKGANVLELASGTGRGLVKMVKAYPNSQFTGLDGDEYSIEVAKGYVKEHEIDDRVSFIHSWFEDLSLENEFDVVIINASMHECRDIDKVTQNIYNALKSDGIFVISDIPFPKNFDEYKSIPNRLMLGINFWELQIDDTLLPRSDYVDLLNKFDFKSVDCFNSTPTQCIVYGYKP